MVVSFYFTYFSGIYLPASIDHHEMVVKEQSFIIRVGDYYQGWGFGVQ